MGCENVLQKKLLLLFCKQNSNVQSGYISIYMNVAGKECVINGKGSKT